MIIKFDFSVEDLECGDKEKLALVFSEAARASILGHHRIIINRAAAKWCLEGLDLTERHKVHISRVGQRYAQLGRQFDEASKKILVRQNAEEDIFYENGTWIISTSEILNGKYFEPAALLLEHATNDGEFYKLMLSLSAKNISFGDVSYNIYHGGGSSCGQELERISKQKMILACICDTDKKTPFGASSDTHNSVFAAYKRSGCIGTVQGTPGREIENFLPLNVVYELAHEKEVVREIEGLIEKQGGDIDKGDCLWLYFDVKDGFPVGILDGYCKNEESRRWIFKKYDIDEESIQEFMIPPLGGNILSSFMNSQELKGSLHKHIRSDYWEKHFFDWVKEILWVVSGGKRERVG